MAVQDRDFEVLAEDGIPVELPSGATFLVITDEEAAYLTQRVRRYLEDNHFVNVSDFQDIDKMVVFELFVHRWSLWLSKGFDYWNDAIDAKALAATVAQYSHELRQLKKNLGMDKPARDRARGDDSIPVYLDSLRQRAMEFGYMRNSQFNQVIEAFKRIEGMLTLYRNCTPEERVDRGVELVDLVEVIEEEVALVNAIDAEFRETSQRMWIRKQ